MRRFGAAALLAARWVTLLAAASAQQDGVVDPCSGSGANLIGSSFPQTVQHEHERPVAKSLSCRWELQCPPRQSAQLRFGAFDTPIQVSVAISDESGPIGSIRGARGDGGGTER